MTNSPFRQAIQLQQRSKQDFLWTPDASWFQGRGVYGGLIFAVVVQSVRAYTEKPLRRLTVDLCAPVQDEATTMDVQELRRGLNTVFLRIDCKQQGKMVATASAICGLPRLRAFDGHHDRFPTDVQPTGTPIPSHPSMPAFTKHFEYWPALGALPFSGATDLYTGGWIRCREESLLDQALIVALLDAWWPAMCLSMKMPRPMGTISCTIDFTHPPLSETLTAPAVLENQCLEIRDGYAIESNLLWSADQILLAKSQQSVVIIR